MEIPKFRTAGEYYSYANTLEKENNEDKALMSQFPNNQIIHKAAQRRINERSRVILAIAQTIQTEQTRRR